MQQYYINIENYIYNIDKYSIENSTINDYISKLQFIPVINDAKKSDEDINNLVRDIFVSSKDYEIVKIFDKLIEKNKLEVKFIEGSLLTKIAKIIYYKIQFWDNSPTTMAYYSLQENKIYILLDSFYKRYRTLDLSDEAKSFLIYTFIHEYIHYYAHNYKNKFIAIVGNYLKKFYDIFGENLDESHILIRKNVNYLLLYNIEQNLTKYFKSVQKLKEDLFNAYFKSKLTKEDLIKYKDIAPGAVKLYILIDVFFNQDLILDKEFMKPIQDALKIAYRDVFDIMPEKNFSYVWQEIIFPSEVICVAAFNLKYRKKILSKII